MMKLVAFMLLTVGGCATYVTSESVYRLTSGVPNVCAVIVRADANAPVVAGACGESPSSSPLWTVRLSDTGRDYLISPIGNNNLCLSAGRTIGPPLPVFLESCRSFDRVQRWQTTEDGHIVRVDNLRLTLPMKIGQSLSATRDFNDTPAQRWFIALALPPA
ncbi:MAG: hypothetical protein J3R72DRAFT_477620 [Linnemannia gamsii]|nr:MAG: hypothetical protein J3R72DRAFT_477620 [Linnemannia gamsii]